jgi:hypothetical protein
MATARTIPATKPVTLREFVAPAAGPGRVDRDAGVVRGVKVLGPESRNGRRYLDDAIRRAAPLYEGAKVYADHPDKPTRDRKVADYLGRLRNVRYCEGCLYADLQVMRSHPLAEQLFEAAESQPFAFGLSHVVDGIVQRRGSEQIVSEIRRVKSVDLVADPATTNGLYEGADMARPKKVLLPASEEMEMAPMDAPAEEPAAEEPAADPLMAGFEAKVLEIFRSDKPWQDKKAMFGELLKAQERLMNMGQEQAASEDDYSDDDGEEEEEESARRKAPAAGEKELREQVAFFQRQQKALELCEAMGVSPTKVLRLALLSAADENEMKQLIREHKVNARVQGGRPRSQSPGRAPAQGTQRVTDGKSFADYITRRG